jgi:tRNA ligase
MKNHKNIDVPNNADLNNQLQQPQIAKKKKPLEYVSVALPRNDVMETLDDAFGGVSSNKARFYRSLEENHRVQPEFHVTLIHRASSKQHPDLWQKYMDRHAEAGGADGWSVGNKFGECQVMLERVCSISFLHSMGRKLTQIDRMG